MHALTDIHDLRHTAIADDRSQCVGLLAKHGDDLLVGEPFDGLFHGDFHRPIEVFVIAHENPIRLRFRPGPFGLAALEYDGLNLDFLVGTLQRRKVDFTIALGAVGIASPDQATFEKHGQI